MYYFKITARAVTRSSCAEVSSSSSFMLFKDGCDELRREVSRSCAAAAIAYSFYKRKIHHIFSPYIFQCMLS